MTITIPQMKRMRQELTRVKAAVLGGQVKAPLWGCKLINYELGCKELCALGLMRQPVHDKILPW